MLKRCDFKEVLISLVLDLTTLNMQHSLFVFDNEEQFQRCNGWTLLFKPLHMFAKETNHIPNYCAKDVKVHQVGWDYNCACMLLVLWKMIIVKAWISTLIGCKNYLVFIINCFCLLRLFICAGPPCFTMDILRLVRVWFPHMEVLQNLRSNKLKSSIHPRKKIQTH
jgi:hypothetical protein